MGKNRINNYFSAIASQPVDPLAEAEMPRGFARLASDELPAKLREAMLANQQLYATAYGRAQLAAELPFLKPWIDEAT